VLHPANAVCRSGQPDETKCRTALPRLGIASPSGQPLVDNRHIFIMCQGGFPAILLVEKWGRKKLLYVGAGPVRT
jgi:hypothetical protein